MLKPRSQVVSSLEVQIGKVSSNFPVKNDYLTSVNATSSPGLLLSRLAGEEGRVAGIEFVSEDT